MERTAVAGDAGTAGEVDDGFAASVGFVVAGVALAATMLPWTPALAAAGLGSPVGAVLAAVALAAFAARRYGVLDRRVAPVAGVAFAALAGYAVAALVGPVVAGGDSPAVGPGLWVGFVLGVAGVAVAYADWRGLSRGALLRRGGAAATAFAVGFSGLLAGTLLEAVPIALFGDRLSPTAQFAAITVLFGVGLGVVALAFLRVTDYGLGYLDVRSPTRRDAVYAAGGVVVIFALLLGLGYLVEALGLGGTQNSLVGRAMETPVVLLALVPLSFLVIGPGEELLFRNVVQKHLAETYSAAGAVLLGCVVFTLMHLPTYYGADPVALFSTLVRLFVLSLVLGVVYERTRNVLVPVVVHGAFNAVQFAALYVVVTRGSLLP